MANYWETPGGTRVHEGSTADDPTDFGIYKGRNLNVTDLRSLVQLREEMEAVIRVLDVSDDVARRLVMRAHFGESELPGG